MPVTMMAITARPWITLEFKIWMMFWMNDPMFPPADAVWARAGVAAAARRAASASVAMRLGRLGITAGVLGASRWGQGRNFWVGGRGARPKTRRAGGAPPPAQVLCAR